MKILITGANGYIGMRLLTGLLGSGHSIICCVRNKKRFPVSEKTHPEIRVVEADFLRPETLIGLPEDIDVAYYLIHSMSDRNGNFSDLEEQSAQNFVGYIDRSRASRIVYLSGITNESKLSEHLKSRKSVEQILAKAKAPLTVLRAGIIVGSGSASFEIMRDLVEKLPVMVAPKWLNTKCQPIAIRNVLDYLKGVIYKPETLGKTYDIGGPDILTYKDMLLKFSKVRGLKRYIIPIPILSPKLSSLWLYFVTSTSFNLARNLVSSMKVDIIARKNHLSELLHIELIPYEEAVALAFQKISQNNVPSSWKDAISSSGSTMLNPDDFVNVPEYGCFKDVKERLVAASPEVVFDNIWKIGGSRGWYYATWLWKLRGYLDKTAGGAGLRRGRRSPNDIFPGDALDFWRVLVCSKTQKRLLLYAEMKMPGEAWLEMKIIEKNGNHIYQQNATFRPKGLAGRLYWYAVWPFHVFVFSGMANAIVRYREG